MKSDGSAFYTEPRPAVWLAPLQFDAVDGIVIVRHLHQIDLASADDPVGWQNPVRAAYDRVLSDEAPR